MMTNHNDFLTADPLDALKRAIIEAMELNEEIKGRNIEMERLLTDIQGNMLKHNYAVLAPEKK